MNTQSLDAERTRYATAMQYLRGRFLAEAEYRGPQAILARSEAADSLVRFLWQQHLPPDAAKAPSLLAVGGYGRRDLFPSSDLDLLFLVGDAVEEKAWKEPLRRFSQQLWDCGLRVAATTRTLQECGRFDVENIEFSISLLDARHVAGPTEPAQALHQEVLPRLLEKERRSFVAKLAAITRERHARYGDTIFHLEPNIKECPGGLRDGNAFGWFRQLLSQDAEPSADFERAFAFLASIRCFLHFRNGRDVNALDWRAQDDAAAEGIGMDDGMPRDPAYWMQLYFRYARTMDRELEQYLDSLPQPRPLLRLPDFLRKRPKAEVDGIRIEAGHIVLEQTGLTDSAQDFETVLRAYEATAETGVRLNKAAEDRIEEALPLLSAQMEEGDALWQHLRRILCGRYAGTALRSMHAQGLLELLVPEFHGIDGLVVRDAYHRYTVDEHTFVLIDTLHGMADVTGGPLAEWAKRLSLLLRELQHPDLLYLAALLHDTGKGRASSEHALESAQLAQSVLQRLDREPFETGLVLHLITNHLEMSAALRRDIFDAETVRAFAARAQTPEELRMLTLFTYADINAVHPDALTPWKAENLWRLYIATANYLDRNLDEERVDSRVSSELVHRVTSLLPGESFNVIQFLEGFPQRYLQTRSPEQIRSHYQMARRLGDDAAQLELVWRADRSEVVVIAPDRRLLFARIAGVLASFGMNILAAEAFSNTRGTVVDSFRFTDTFRTLELNPGERERLKATLHDAVNDESIAGKIIASRRRSRRKEPLVVVTTSIKFDTVSSSHSTIVQVVSQDHPGLLYAIAQTLGEERCNIEVALIDTEGDTAIDVFYLTRDSSPLDAADLAGLESRLLDAIAANAT